MTACWLAKCGHMEKGDPMPPCEGRLVRVHLIEKQRLKRAGLEWGDPATFVMGCGGLSGVGGHHGLFDGYRLTVPFDALPSETIVFAGAHGLLPYLESRYS